MLSPMIQVNSEGGDKMCPPLCIGAPCNEKLVGRVSASAAEHDTSTQHPQHLEERDKHLFSVFSF